MLLALKDIQPFLFELITTNVLPLNVDVDNLPYLLKRDSKMNEFSCKPTDCIDRHHFFTQQWELVRN